jgi:hypothetical protein
MAMKRFSLLIQGRTDVVEQLLHFRDHLFLALECLAEQLLVAEIDFLELVMFLDPAVAK